MKKTLIALAVAASAVVSGSAVAWNPGGSGGTLNLGGELDIAGEKLPWDVAVGAGVKDLNAMLEKGAKSATIALKGDIPVLGLRLKGDTFYGKQGLSPNIDYGTAINVDKISNGVVDTRLDVKSEHGDVIGTMTVPLWIAAESMDITVTQGRAGESISGLDRVMPFANTKGDLFYGGVAKNAKGVWNDKTAHDFMKRVFSDIDAHWQDFERDLSTPHVVKPVENNHKYNGMYASAFPSGKNIVIKLNSPLQTSTVWQASMPITISYL